MEQNNSVHEISNTQIEPIESSEQSSERRVQLLTLIRDGLPTLKDSKFQLLNALALRSGADGTIPCISYQTLMRDTRLSDLTLRRSVGELVEAGYLSRKQGKGRGAFNTLTINVAAIEQAWEKEHESAPVIETNNFVPIGENPISDTETANTEGERQQEAVEAEQTIAG